MTVQCPRCNTNVYELVKEYQVINTKIGKGYSIKIEKAVCEECIEELMDEIIERHNNEQ